MQEEEDINIKNNPQVILSWKAPLRPYKNNSGVILRFYLAITLLISLIVFFFGDNVLLIPIWAILFLFYILTITPPPDVESKITRFGLETAGISVRWEALSYFYFKRRFGFDVLTVVGHSPYYYHMYLVIPNSETKKKVFSILSQHLIYKDKPQENITDKLVELFSRFIPDEDSSSKEDSAHASSKVSVAAP